MSPETTITDLVANRLARGDGSPLVLGLCGAQGSGKSTLAARLAARFPRSAILSLDDLYLTRGERQTLARDVHPLLATRGVPGTHDIELGIATLDAIASGKAAPLPRFDKASDDRTRDAQWPMAPADCSLLIFEGWCVGASAQSETDLREPVNALEREEDRDGDWRRYVNSALGGAYQALFARIDALALLTAPDWPTVLRWRRQQEAALRRRAGEGVGVMTDEDLIRFVSHYERLTRHIWAEMPSRADVTIPLDQERRVSDASGVD